MTESIKVVVVGDGDVGKTCLALCFSKGEFPEDYIPTICDNYNKTVRLSKEADIDVIKPMGEGEGEDIGLSIYDTAGTETYDSMRSLVYPGTHVFLVCFSTVNRVSFENWVGEIRSERELRDIPIIIVGTKADLREKSTSGAVSSEEGRAMAEELGVWAYVETSAREFKNLNEAFAQVTVAGLGHKHKLDDEEEEREAKKRRKGFAKFISKFSPKKAPATEAQPAHTLRVTLYT